MVWRTKKKKKKRGDNNNDDNNKKKKKEKIYLSIYLSIYHKVRVDQNRYELTKIGTSWLVGYELTKEQVRVDQK